MLLDLLYCGMVMSLGWGLRGFIGGGPLGAMIPGALVTLALIRIKRWRLDPLLLAFGAVGIGMGGEETYGQTVGFARDPETYWWAALGLGLKGAVWGLLGGAILGWGLIAERTRVWLGVLLMPAAAWIGWRFINHPKLLYFSNRLDRPREEVWAGMLFAALALLVWLASRDAWRFAIAGFVGGGIGFGGGGAWMLLAKANPGGDWWKCMEWTFGFCFGVALAWAASRVAAGPPEDRESGDAPWWVAYPLAFAVTAATTGGEAYIPLRFGYLVTGSLLVLLVYFWRPLGWAVGLAVAFLASARDLSKHTDWDTMAIALSLVWVALAIRFKPFALWILLGGCLIVSQFKAGAMTQVQIVFWSMAIVIAAIEHAQGKEMKPWRIFQR